ncbi:MAG: glycerol-3-phosphate acyltransferase [Smithellaceae bacterium]
MNMVSVVLVCIAAYLAGSINFAILFFKIAGRADPRLSFSGNAGTTNVYRQAGLSWAVLVFALDIGRALGVAVMSVYFINGEWLVWAGFFLVLGNTLPCFHGFRGGKGVANFLGFTILIAPWAAMLSAMVWICVYWLKRMPFLASLFMVATLSVGHGVIFQWAWPTAAGALAAFALITLNHRKNILDALRDDGASVQSS